MKNPSVIYNGRIFCYQIILKLNLRTPKKHPRLNFSQVLGMFKNNIAFYKKHKFSILLRNTR